VCKVGGEVESSVIHSFSNKQHDGFLGHSYLGMWVNLGADTNNSDLKNNYGSVKVMINDEQIDSGSQFMGLTMGDHAKTAINTMFNTGTVVGVACNVLEEVSLLSIYFIYMGGPRSYYNLRNGLEV
jgi:NDP-sugar pyrophosphorylase family protein